VEATAVAKQRRPSFRSDRSVWLRLTGELGDSTTVGKLLACCSKAISIAVMLGGALLPFLSQPSQLRAGFSWFANQLPNERSDDVSCLSREELPPASSQSLGERTGPAMAPFKSGPEVNDPIGIVLSTTADAQHHRRNPHNEAGPAPFLCNPCRDGRRA
jgi:hypothetical protein